MPLGWPAVVPAGGAGEEDDRKRQRKRHRIRDESTARGDQGNDDAGERESRDLVDLREHPTQPSTTQVVTRIG